MSTKVGGADKLISKPRWAGQTRRSCPSQIAQTVAQCTPVNDSSGNAAALEKSQAADDVDAAERMSTSLQQEGTTVNFLPYIYMVMSSVQLGSLKATRSHTVSPRNHTRKATLL
ncbi:hypothetical protein Cni_G05458 [Canna indica]|uniref:Uncharacterized protein n=1 Tax=Canna indica TaxID=4628 RepID=A0AAQ3JVA7_9LILI|nr:hypothetical protein Cni_G05458 [Canna indica]